MCVYLYLAAAVYVKNEYKICDGDHETKSCSLFCSFYLLFTFSCTKCSDRCDDDGDGDGDEDTNGEDADRFRVNLKQIYGCSDDKYFRRCLNDETLS